MKKKPPGLIALQKLLQDVLRRAELMKGLPTTAHEVQDEPQGINVHLKGFSTISFQARYIYIKVDSV